jgi:PAS domain S-box-containing protein
MPAENDTMGSPNELFLISKALRAVDSGIIVTDRDARIVWVNPAFSQSIGYKPAEILGKTPSLFKSGKHSRRFYRGFWDTILCGKTWRGQFTNRRRDGSICVHSQITTPVCQDGSGEITHFISINEELVSSRKCAPELCEDRDQEIAVQLAAGIAHHLNNLLTVVHCNSSLVLDRSSGLDPASKDLLERTLAASHRAADLIRQLVGFSRSQTLQLQPLNLNDVVESCLNVFRRNFKAGIEWKTDYRASLPSVLADSVTLVQVISNLVTNALHAMPAGGQLTVATEKIMLTGAELKKRHLAAPGGVVCLAVRDTGCGIPPTELTRVFEPFFTTKDAGNHSGLGLALVQGIIHQHGGWTEVNSILGQGTTFKIFLPAISISSQPKAVKPAGAKQLNHSSQAMLFLPLPAEESSVAFAHWGINE